MGSIRQFFRRQVSLERRLFWSILVVVTLVAASSAAFTIYEGLNLTAILTSFTLFAVGAVAMRSYEKERLSMRDPLTEVYNRRYLMTFLENEIWRRRDSYYLFLLDLDDLDRLNYNYGHAFGDRALTSIAQILNRKVVSPSKECVARFSSGSFVFVMEAPSEGDALTRAEQIRRDVENLRLEENSMVRLTISGGFVACASHGLLSVKQALDKSMELLQVAKSLGKNQIRGMMDS